MAHTMVPGVVKGLRKGRPRQRCADQVTKNVTMLGIRNWPQAARARDVWHRKLAKAKTCNRLERPKK